MGGLPLHQSDPIDFPIGLCPQHDVLYESLTVRDHLILYWSIKRGSVPSEPDITLLASQTGLAASLTSKTGNLSQGNKRKLSVALATCGNQKLLLLDEPTSAMGKTKKHCYIPQLFLTCSRHCCASCVLEVPKEEKFAGCCSGCHPQHYRSRSVGRPVCLFRCFF